MIFVTKKHIFLPNHNKKEGSAKTLPFFFEIRQLLLRGGKGNRHYGHRKRGTFAFAHLATPKQRTVLFCEMRCSSIPNRVGRIIA